MSEDNRDPVRAALVELVALKDLKDEFEAIDQAASTNAWRQFSAKSADYERRKPLAWAAARAAISTPAGWVAGEGHRAEYSDGHWAVSSVQWDTHCPHDPEVRTGYMTGLMGRMRCLGCRVEIAYLPADPPKEPPPIKETR